MASLMENLIDVLDRESTEYEALLQLSQRKTPIIAGGDLAELQKITDEEQELVSRIHNLDNNFKACRKYFVICAACGTAGTGGFPRQITGSGPGTEARERAEQ